jgi:hypothetical protein
VKTFSQFINIPGTIIPMVLPASVNQPEHLKSQFQKDQERMAKGAAGAANAAEIGWRDRYKGKENSEAAQEEWWRIQQSRQIQ